MNRFQLKLDSLPHMTEQIQLHFKSLLSPAIKSFLGGGTGAYRNACSTLKLYWYKSVSQGLDILPKQVYWYNTLVRMQLYCYNGALCWYSSFLFLYGNNSTGISTFRHQHNSIHTRGLCHFNYTSIIKTIQFLCLVKPQQIVEEFQPWTLATHLASIQTARHPLFLYFRTE